MRVCLVAPPTIELFEEGLFAQSRVSREVAEHTPLGVLTLAAVLDRHGIESQLLDLNQLYFSRSWLDAYHYRQVDFCELAVSEISTLAFDVLGLSTMCSTYPLSLRIAREIKQRRPQTVIVLGGPQASVVDEATLAAFPFVDAIVRGEAEESFPQFLKALEAGRGLDGIAGITFRSRGEIVRTPNASVIKDLDCLPLPAFHRYSRVQDCTYLPIEIGRGCPFACTFCSTNDFFRRNFRLKSPAHVIEQMRFLEQTYGVTRFELVHDMFTVDRRRVVEFCEALLSCGRRFTWSCSARTDSVDDELLSLMSRAGCRGIFFGIETGSQRMQKVIHKNLDIVQAAKLLEATRDAGVAITVAFIDGFPEEEKEDLAASVDFMMNATRFDHVSPQMNILAPLAKTPLLTQYRNELVLDDVFSDMSHQGWRQDEADRDLIAAYPDIFPNFYGVPCAVGRAYVDEFNRFLANGLLRFRWLMIALHQQSGNLLSVFDRWLASQAIARNPAKYYCTVAFSRDFKSFLRNVYLRQYSVTFPGIEGLLEYYEMLDAVLCPAQGFSEPSPESDAAKEWSAASIPRLSNGTCVLRLRMDVKSIIESLRAKSPVPEDVLSPTVMATRDARTGETALYKMPSLSAMILDLCDGRRDVQSVIRKFSKIAGLRSAQEAEAVCLQGLALLNQHSLIEFGAASY
jgi:radical SAM superfamily enzyme YgiQ (UPF0313 family)